MRFRLLRRAMSITRLQYSSGRLLISSDALRNCTRVMSIPTALQISTMYCRGQGSSWGGGGGGQGVEAAAFMRGVEDKAAACPAMLESKPAKLSRCTEIR